MPKSITTLELKYYNQMSVTVEAKGKTCLVFISVIFHFIAFNIWSIILCAVSRNMLEFAWKSIRFDKKDTVIFT